MRWARVLAATGALAAVLSGTGFALLGTTSLGGAFGPDPTRGSYADAVATPAPRLAFVGIALDAIGHVLLLIFVVVLADVVRRAGEALAGIALAIALSGALAVLLTMGDVAAAYALALGSGGLLSPEGAAAIGLLHAGFFTAAWAFTGLFVALAGLASLRGAGVPKWVGVPGLAIGAASFAALAVPDSALSQFAAMAGFAWIGVASIALTVRHSP